MEGEVALEAEPGILASPRGCCWDLICFALNKRNHIHPDDIGVHKERCSTPQHLCRELQECHCRQDMALHFLHAEINLSLHSQLRVQP